MQKDDLIKILNHFSNQFEGSLSLYSKCEIIFIDDNFNFNFDQLTNLFKAYFNMKKGSKEFIKAILSKLNPLLDDELLKENPDVNQIIKLILILKEVKNENNLDRETMLYRLLNFCKSKYERFTFEQICLIAKGFGRDFINEDFAIDLQNCLYPEMSEISFEEFELFLSGFVDTYLIDPDLYKIIRKKILDNLEKFELVALMRLSRSVYLLNIVEEKEIWDFAEKTALSMLKNYEEHLGVQEYFEMILTFHMTRKGSREFFKIIESKFIQRLEDFEDDVYYLEKISKIFAKSGLVHPDSVEQVNAFLTLNQ